MITARRSSYRSNVRQLTQDIGRKLESAVGKAAREASAETRSLSDPPVAARALPAETQAHIVVARVVVPAGQFWAQILDLGSLGKRTVPLKYPGKRESSWPVTRRLRRGSALARSGTIRSVDYTADRTQEALSSGGIEPQYFFIRGKRFGQRRLLQHVRDALR